MNDIVYKVVLVKPDGQRISAMGNALPHDWVLTYTPGQQVVPKEGKIFAFLNKEEAITWAAINCDVNESMEVWECQSEGLTKACVCFYTNSSSKEFSEFWKSPMPLGTSTPIGTVFVEALTLTCRIEALSPEDYGG